MPGVYLDYSVALPPPFIARAEADDLVCDNSAFRIHRIISYGCQRDGIIDNIGNVVKGKTGDSDIANSTPFSVAGSTT